MKDDILSTHNELEDIFNHYDTEDDTSSKKDEDSLESDISRLLKSTFFNKKKLENDDAAQDLDLDTDDIQGELKATLGGGFSNVESGVGAEFTEADTEDAEDAPATESATSESETKSETAPATTVESAVAPVPEISALE